MNSGASWGWPAYVTSGNATTIYPQFTVSGDGYFVDSTASNPPLTERPKFRSPLDWLRSQIEEMTELAVA